MAASPTRSSQHLWNDSSAVGFENRHCETASGEANREFSDRLFPLLFIPGAVGIMELWNVLEKLWLPILIALIPVTVLTFAVSGWTTQWIAGRKKHD